MDRGGGFVRISEGTLTYVSLASLKAKNRTENSAPNGADFALGQNTQQFMRVLFCGSTTCARMLNRLFPPCHRYGCTDVAAL